MASFQHVTVLLEESVDLVSPRAGGVYLDCTLGGGGHTELLLERCGPDGLVFGIDRDPKAIAASAQRLERFSDRFVALQGSFGDVQELLEAQGVRQIDGLIADLGVSSPQLDESERGFSFMRDGPLDMRMGPGLKRTAADLVNTMEQGALADVIYAYGEERHSRRVAAAIVRQRPFARTGELADVVRAAVPGRKGRIDAATRTFQALRIAVNEELAQLETLLALLPTLIKPGGRAAVISFHSLEDRLVKTRFRMLAGVGTPRDAYGNPVVPPAAVQLTRKPIVSSDTDNPRARSARLRGIEFLKQSEQKRRAP